MIRLVSFVVVMCGCLCVHAGDANQAEEVKWARGVLHDFLESAKARDIEQAELLMTREFRQAMDKFEGFVGNGFKGWLLTREIPGESWKITAEEISPDRDEVVLKGHFKRDKEEAAFSARILKETDSGKWRVTYLYTGGWFPEKPGVKKK